MPLWAVVGWGAVETSPLSSAVCRDEGWFLQGELDEDVNADNVYFNEEDRFQNSAHGGGGCVLLRLAMLNRGVTEVAEERCTFE